MKLKTGPSYCLNSIKLKQTSNKKVLNTQLILSCHSCQVQRKHLCAAKTHRSCKAPPKTRNLLLKSYRKRMTRHNWNVVVGQECGHTKQMVGVNVCEAGSHEHAKGKWWSNRLMSVSSCAGWRCYWCSLLAYLACQRDAPCGHRGSADSVGWQQSEGDRPASPTPGCFHWQPPPWAWPASGAWAHPWSGWLATVSPWGGRRKEVISQRAQWATIKILHFSKLTFGWAGKSLFFLLFVCVCKYTCCAQISTTSL